MEHIMLDIMIMDLKLMLLDEARYNLTNESGTPRDSISMSQSKFCLYVLLSQLTQSRKKAYRCS